MCSVLHFNIVFNLYSMGSIVPNFLIVHGPGSVLSSYYIFNPSLNLHVFERLEAHKTQCTPLLLLSHGWGWVGVIASWLGWLIASSKRTHVVPLQRRGWHRGAILARTNVSQHKAPLRWSSTTLVNLWLTLDAQLCLFFKVHRLSARGEGAITMLNSCCWLRIFTITPHTCSLCYCNF